jgi:16S rRNA (uracil1498-N3)-methyltransferase
MPRLYLNHPLAEKTIIPLNPEQSHYLAHVLRQNIGDSLFVFNATAGEWRAKIYQITKKQVVIEIVDQQQSVCLTPTLWLAFAPLKQDATNFLLEKATELGVTHLQPLWMERSNTQRLNQQRWEKIVIEASEQCERYDIPHILPSLSLAAFLKDLPQNMEWFAAIEREASKYLLAVLQTKQTAKWGFIIGPEGGFSTTEQHLLHQHPSICAINLGPRILRAETAGLTVLAIAQSMLIK